jgi:ABC-type multidrug transport system fused ATPase/permease subunit
MSEQSSVASALYALLPLVPTKEKRRFIGLLALSLIMALAELALTGLVALLAAIFGSPEAVLHNNPVRWLRETLGVSFDNDPRLLALAALCGIFLFIVGKNILNIAHQRQMAAFSESVGAAARTRLFRFFQRAPFLWITHTGVAELNFGLSAAAQLATTLGIALQIFSNVLMILTLFVGLVSVSPVPSLMFLVVLGLGGILIVKAVRKFLDNCSHAVYTADYQVNKITHLALHGLKEIRLYGREDALFSAYTEQLGKFAKARTRQQTVIRLPVASLEALGFGTLVVVMLYLVCIQDAGMARIAGIMGFMAAAAWRGLPVANRLVDAVAAMRGWLPYLRKAAELINLERDLADELLPLDAEPAPLSFERDIIIENVSFRYPKAAAEAVRGVSMTIRAGTMVGLVGTSGAGKSTLANLLTGLMPPASGRLLVDGVPITKDNARSWLRRIGYVAQAPYILDASLAENVALSRWGEPIDRERVLECCRMAALDFVDELELGIDTVLGDRGTRLSGGQAQRVAIARALYSGPDLIIFDEATSSLDMKNEKAIHETILSLRDRVTMVVIAHRLTTVEGCDSIVWMEKGMVHRAGNPQEVLPEYQKVLRSQETMKKEHHV